MAHIRGVFQYSRQINQQYVLYYFIYYLMIWHGLAYSTVIMDQLSLSWSLQYHYIVIVKIQILSDNSI